jgi:hypothetical protein
MDKNKLHKCINSVFCILVSLYPFVHTEKKNNVKLVAGIRNYFFQRDFKGGSTDKESLAIGAILRGRIHPHPNLSAGMSLYTSQGAGLNDREKDVYNLLAEDSAGDHENYTALGEAFFEIHNEDISFKLGRQEMFTPRLNRHDVRRYSHAA